MNKIVHEDKYWIVLPTRDGDVSVDAIALYQDIFAVPTGPKREEWKTKNYFEDEVMFALEQNGIIEWSEYSGTCMRGTKFDQFVPGLANALNKAGALNTRDGGPDDFINAVHCLIYSMVELGYDGTESWFGQDFLHVKNHLERMGRSCVPKDIDEVAEPATE